MTGESPKPPGAAAEIPSNSFVAFNAAIDESAYALEPTLAVTPEGVLFTYANRESDLTTPGVLNLHMATVFRSVDDGRSWQALDTPLYPQPDADPHITADADGTIWYDQLGVGTAGVAVSQDEGATWWADPGVSRGPVYDRPYVVPTEGGTAFLFYLTSPEHTVAWKTTDHGRTWTPTGPVHLFPLVGSGWSGGGFWNEAVGSVYFTFPVREPGIPLQAVESIMYPGFAVTRDGGLTFEVGVVPSDAWARGDLADTLADGAADRSGNVYLSWVEQIDGAWHVQVAASTDDGRTWPLMRTFSTGDGTRIFPTITAAGDGEVAVAFYETDAVGHPEELPADSDWNVTVAYTNGFFDDGPILRGNLSLERVHLGPACVSGNGCQEIRQLADFFDIDLLPDGRLGGVWTKSVPGDRWGTVVYGETDVLFPTMD